MTRKRLNLACFFISSALNVLAVLGVVIAIADPLPLPIEAPTVASVRPDA